MLKLHWASIKKKKIKAEDLTREAFAAILKGTFCPPLHGPPLMASDKVKRTILLDRDEYERFKGRHPGHGDFVWFVREALRLYNDLNTTTSEELIDLAVREITLKQ